MITALTLLSRYWLHVIVLGVALYGLGRYTEWVYESGYNAANVRAEQVIAEMARAEAAAQGKARAAERRSAVAIADITEQYERDRADAQTAADRLAAGLRAGNVRLRDHWAGCETDNLSGDATAARRADEAARVRAESAARIIAAADEADAQVRGLQRYAGEVNK